MDCFTTGKCTPVITDMPDELALGSPCLIFPGGFDQHGCSLLLFPKSQQKQLLDLSTDSINKIIKYFLYLHSPQQFGGRLLSFLVDLRTATTDVIVLIVKSLRSAQKNHPGGVIRTFYVLQPRKRATRKCLLKSLGVNRNKSPSEAPFTCVLLNDPCELFNYIDQSQLTPEFGGYLRYDHEQWLSFRKEIDNITSHCATVFKRLPSCIASLEALKLDPLPTEENELNAFSHHVQCSYLSIRNDLGIDELYSKFTEIVQNLQKPEVNDQAMSGSVMLETLVNMQSYKQQIQCSVDKMELLVQKAHSKAQLALEICEHTRDARQIADLISAQMKKLETYGVQIASNNVHANALKEQYVSDMYNPTIALIERAAEVIRSLEKLEGGGKVKHLLDRLCKLKEKLYEAVEIPSQILGAICDYNSLFLKAASWYHLVLSQVSFKNAKWSEMGRKLGFANSAWKLQADRFLIQHPPPDPGELLRMGKLFNRLSKFHPEIERQQAMLLSQRCCVLLKLMTCNEHLLLSDVQQAIYWQEHLVSYDTESFLTEKEQTVDGIHSFPKEFTKSGQDGSNLSKTTTNVNSPTDSASQSYANSTLGKGLSIFKKTMHNTVRFQSKATQNVITGGPRAKSSNSCKPVPDQCLRQIGLQASKEVLGKTHCMTKGLPNMTYHSSCICCKNILDSFIPGHCGNGPKNDVNRCSVLPKNPWLSLPLEDLEMPYDVTILPSNLAIECMPKGVCRLCSVQLKGQSSQALVFTNVATYNPLKTNTVEIQVGEGNLKSICSLQESAVQTDESTCSKLSKIPNDCHERSPIKIVLSNTLNKAQEHSKDRIDPSPCIAWDNFDRHLPRRHMNNCQEHRLPNGIHWLSDWELKEQEELCDIEILLDKTENILWVMSPEELSDAGVIGIEDVWSNDAQLLRKTYWSDWFMDNEQELARPGYTLHQENRVASKPQNASRLFGELEELYAIEAKIWNENLKIEQLRELERRGKVSKENSLCNLTAERLSFLAELEKERHEVEEMENNLAKEGAIKKRKLRKILELNKNNSHHKNETSKYNVASAFKPVTPATDRLNGPSCRMVYGNKNRKGRNCINAMKSSSAGVSGIVQTSMRQLENKQVNQAEAHKDIQDSTECKEQDSRMVQGSESNTKDAPSSSNGAEQVKLNLAPAFSAFKKCPEQCGIIASGEHACPKPRKAMLAKPCNPSFGSGVPVNYNNVMPKDLETQESVHVCRAKINLKENEAKPEVMLNISPVELQKTLACTDTENTLAPRVSQMCSRFKSQQGSNNYGSGEKCDPEQNVAVVHNSPGRSEEKYLSTFTFSQVREKQESLEAKTKTNQVYHTNTGDIHLVERLTKLENACLKSKKQDVSDLHGDMFLENDSKKARSG
ncbi:uncharacterized protein [Ambystoma mexicanum]|uniref:uncharacterized protein isoform X2 n=1 Tax=Ambystoma mexicanum TaxID=8296 RepID=UPI0037E99AFF